MNKKCKCFLSTFLAALMLVSILPISAFAAPNSNIPKAMLDNAYLDALEYTGYNVQAQKNDGSIFVKTNVSSAIRSNIGYGTGPSGLETVSDSSTVTGLAPNIAKFEQSGLCCASYVSYVYFNYLPNVAGIDTSGTPCPANARSASSYNTAANNWVTNGQARRIDFTQSSDGTNFNPSEDIPIGSLIVFKHISSGSIAHVAIYAGYYNGNHFVTHVGNDNGPEFCTVVGMSKGGTPEIVAQIVVPEFIESTGLIEVYKKDTDGKALSGAVFTATSTTDATLQYKIGPTDSNGYAYLENVKYGTYKIKETVFPTNFRCYGQSEWTVTLDSKTTNGTITVNAVNELIPGSCKIVKTSEDGKVEGISFRITGNGVDKTVKTANGGQITVNDLKPGVYTVTETVADKYTPQETRRVTVVSGQTATVTFNNTLKRGSLTVTKTSEDGLNSGVKFHLYGTSLSGLAVDEYAVTDSSGKAYFKDVLIGTGYTLEETDTAVRYVVPDSQIANIEWNTVTNKSFNNTLKKWKLTVTKSDSQTGTPQGDATLSGAVYGVYKGEQLIDSYTTDKNGRFTTKYYICGDDWTLREITASEGYLVNTTKEHIGVEAKNYTVEYNTAVMDVTETVKKGKIALIKHADDGSTQIETPEENAEFKVYLKSSGGYENAKDTERDILVTDKYGYAETKALPYGVYTVEQTKGLDGKELMLPFDVFISENGEVYRYLINNATFESLVEIVKKDAETGKIIPAANIGFKVRNTDTGEYVVQHINYPTPTDIEIYYTDNTGKLMLPEKLPFGNYEIIEQRTAYGYVLDSTPVEFKIDGTKTTVTVEKYNIAQKGVITVSKTGEVFSSVSESGGIYQPVYENKGLAGAVFEVIAAEDIYTLDGTLRYAKGTVADTVTTDKDGTAKTKELYLGKYDIKEITAPYGMVLNGEVKTVELTYAGQEIAVTGTSTQMYNERQKAIILFSKVLETDSKFGIGNSDEILSVRFGLYATEDITAADGKVIPKDALLEITFCDKDGKITFNTDIPIGAKLYVKEIATDEHYIVSSTEYPVIFEYAGQDTAIVKIAVNNGEKIENTLIRGNVLGKKVDEDGFEIGGALFGLFKSNETEFTEDTALLISQSNEIGVFAFSDVPYGKYIVREIKVASAFVLNDTAYEVVIFENEQTVEIEIENRFITGNVKTVKVDKDYPENKLSGAVFEVYVDVDGNKEFDKEIDLLVGEMCESENGVYTYEKLRYNGYFLHEKTAPTGFVRDDGYYYFEIRNDGETVVVANKSGIGFTNEAVKGNIKVIKKDADTGKLLSGVEFGLFDLAGNEIAKGITDENGELLFENIRFGKYELKELVAKDGYLKNDNIISVEIAEHGQVLTFEVTNQKIPTTPDVPHSPQTGDNSNIGLWLTVMCLSFSALIGLCVYNRKTQNC